MSLVFYNGSTGLMDKLGQIFGLAQFLTDNRTDVNDRIATARAAYEAANQYMISPLSAITPRLTSAKPDPAILACQRAAATTLIAYVNESIPLPSLDVPTALRAMYQAMVDQSESVAKNTVSTSAGYSGSAVGNGSFVAPVTANLPQLLIPQTVTARCVADAYTGATAGNEVFQIVSPVANTNGYDTLWNNGSGQSLTTTPLNYFGGPGVGPNVSALSNGSFSSFTGSAPDDWTIQTGSSVITSTATALRGSVAMSWTGDGVTLQDIRQNLDGAVGALLQPNRNYILALWLRYAGSAPTGGSIDLEVIGDSGAIATATLPDASLSTTYQYVQTSFSTTDLVPTAPYVKLSRKTTAIPAGREVYISCAYLSEVSSFGGGTTGVGSRFLIYSGSTSFRKGDTLTLISYNNYGGKVQTWFDRVFNTGALGIELPSSNSPTIPNSVVV